jgi:hypothetical protein
VPWKNTKSYRASKIDDHDRLRGQERLYEGSMLGIILEALEFQQKEVNK